MSSFIKLVLVLPIALLSLAVVPANDAAPKVKTKLGNLQGNLGFNPGDLKLNFNFSSNRRTGQPGSEQRQTPTPPVRTGSSSAQPKQR